MVEIEAEGVKERKKTYFTDNLFAPTRKLVHKEDHSLKEDTP